MIRRTLAIMVLLLAGCGGPAISPSHNFSLRMADSKSNPGMTEVTMRSSGETMFLNSKDLISSEDVENVRIAVDATGKPCIELRVKKAFSAQLREITSANKGKMIAMVINGIPELAIPISEPFDDTIWITGDYTKAEAEQTYSAITGYD